MSIDQLLALKFTARQLARNSKKSELDESKQKRKLKLAIEKGNIEGARIYAQNAIRSKNLATNYLRLSSRVDAVASRVENAIRMNTVTDSMSKIVRTIESSMKSMNLEKIAQIMDQFEKQFENLDIQSEFIEKSISDTTALITPQEQVDDLIAMTAEMYNIDLKEKLPQLPESSIQKLKNENQKNECDELMDRLTKLKSS
ncbi:charged multivesicular body protein 1-like [Schistocerca gregaria]|uniref:charged multivesicular body protein 1-like n=1 Tax=Schistocerca gregaria TaxID=7010 RepID=UPI00211DAF5C|nr:charged multivesicular body protein 1-like [Schistocerca gregaria]